MSGLVSPQASAPAKALRPPRLGFLGAGWIGRNRMQAILDEGAAQVCAIADPSADCAAEANRIAPHAAIADDLEAILALGLDGIVIATPSALHAEQAIAALEAGVAVFCQKPLGRNAAETTAVVDAARRAGLPLGVDLSYRRTAGLCAVRSRLEAGGIGKVFAVDMVFHNAYGPDKAWFYDPALSGGGCVVDLGVHLADALLWCLDYPTVHAVSSRLLRSGEPLAAGEVEDYAVATLDLDGGAVARLACSWRLHAGCDAQIAMKFHGTDGTLAFENVAGSFYDFRARLLRGASSETLADGEDAWGGRMAVEWTHRLARGEGFDAESWRHVETARLLDRIYGRTASATLP